MSRLSVLAGEPHFLDHLAPVWRALPEEVRGEFYILAGLEKRAHRAGIAPRDFDENRISGPVLVASWGDLRRIRQRGIARIAFMEHGAGQSYAGDHQSAEDPSYPGGRGREDVALTLVPNKSSATRWRGAYPGMDVRVVGCPKLDQLPTREPGPKPVVALSFHYNAGNGSPEGNSAFHHYRQVLPVLAQHFDLIGHAHPRWAERLADHFTRAGIRFVADFDDVCRQADVYLCDNSSTLFEFASTGRPVVVLNSPDYRRDVNHGLRFWEAATVGVQVDGPSADEVWDRRHHRRLIESIELAIADPPAQRAAREAALKLAYAYRTGAAKRAADILAKWMASAPTEAAAA